MNATLAPLTLWQHVGSSVVDNSIPESLNFDVNLEPVYRKLGDEFQPVRGRRVVSHSKTNEILGFVGNTWEAYTNQQMWEVLVQYCQMTKGSIENAGFYRDFSWACVKHEEYEVLKNDPIIKYDMFVNPFEGGRSFNLINTDIRISCGNALTSALSNSTGVFRIRHSREINANVKIAAEASAASIKMRSAQVNFLKALTKKSISSEIINSFSKKVFMINEKSSTKTLSQAEDFKNLVEQGFGADIKGVNGTAYGLYQAAIEYADHHLSVRGSVHDRFRSSLVGKIAEFKNRSTKLAIDLAA